MSSDYNRNVWFYPDKDLDSFKNIDIKETLKIYNFMGIFVCTY